MHLPCGNNGNSSFKAVRSTLKRIFQSEMVGEIFFAFKALERPGLKIYTVKNCKSGMLLIKQPAFTVYGVRKRWIYAFDRWIRTFVMFRKGSHSNILS